MVVVWEGVVSDAACVRSCRSRVSSAGIACRQGGRCDPCLAASVGSPFDFADPSTGFSFVEVRRLSPTRESL